jgi:hypothetical protein
MPRAVPSRAAVLMIPDAVPRQRGSTSVPSPVAATDERPIPAPAAATRGEQHRHGIGGPGRPSHGQLRQRSQPQPIRHPPRCRCLAISRQPRGASGQPWTKSTGAPSAGPPVWNQASFWGA